MRLSEQFTIGEPPSTVWKLFEEAELVAGCMPGIDRVEVADPDNVRVRLTQRIGPMSATFDARVHVLERVDGQSITFEAVGKSIRGAVGSVRCVNQVTLASTDDGTLVSVDGDVVLAGALGSVGQKVAARQAGKVTEAFVANLRKAIAGELSPGALSPAAASPIGRAVAPPQTTGEPGLLPETGLGPDWWSRVAVALGAASVVLDLLVLLHLRRRDG